MLDPERIPPVDAGELTARFIIDKRHIYKETQTLKPNAFMPKPYVELSVTRILEITDDEIWEVGRKVACQRKPERTLRGRADVLAGTYIGQKLLVEADPVVDNPNHANVTGWPPPDEESGQLLIAKEIAAVAKFVSPP